MSGLSAPEIYDKYPNSFVPRPQDVDIEISKAIVKEEVCPKVGDASENVHPESHVSSQCERGLLV